MNARESIRLKQFRQLKKEIRRSKDHLMVGIDVAKDTVKHYSSPPLVTHSSSDWSLKRPLDSLRGSSSR
jgi:hypothetical protein